MVKAIQLNVILIRNIFVFFFFFFFSRGFKHRPGQENVAEGVKTMCYECAIKGFCD